MKRKVKEILNGTTYDPFALYMARFNAARAKELKAVQHGVPKAWR